jgi:Ca2+-binding RTX toxin-like protein
MAFSGATAVTVNLATLTAQNTGGAATPSPISRTSAPVPAPTTSRATATTTPSSTAAADTYNGAGGIGHGRLFRRDLDGHGQPRHPHGPEHRDLRRDRHDHQHRERVGSRRFGNTCWATPRPTGWSGGAAADTIQGNNGNDTIFGGAGNDILNGGTNGALDDGTADTLEGGAGNDYPGRRRRATTSCAAATATTPWSAASATRPACRRSSPTTAATTPIDGGDGTDIAILLYDTDRRRREHRRHRLRPRQSRRQQRDHLGRGQRRLDDQHRAGHLPRHRSSTTRQGRRLARQPHRQCRRRRPRRLARQRHSVRRARQRHADRRRGLDTATYVNSTAGVTVDLRIQGVAQNTGGEGIDTLIGIEYLTGSNFGDTLRGQRRLQPDHRQRRLWRPSARRTRCSATAATTASW